MNTLFKAINVNNFFMAHGNIITVIHNSSALQSIAVTHSLYLNLVLDSM